MYLAPRSFVSILACAGVASSQCHQSEEACQACGKTSLEYKYCTPQPPATPPSPATPPPPAPPLSPPSPHPPLVPMPPMPPYKKKPEKHAAKMSERHRQHGEARDADASDEDADASDEDADASGVAHEDAVVPQHVHGAWVSSSTLFDAATAALTQPPRADGDDGVDAERSASGATLGNGLAHSEAETTLPSTSGPKPSAALGSQTASSQEALTLGAASVVRTRPAPPSPDSSNDIGDVFGKESSTLSSISRDHGSMDGSMTVEALLVVGLALGALFGVGLCMMRGVADLWAGLRTRGGGGKVVGEATRRAYEPVVPTVSKEFENDSSEDGDDVSIIY